MNVEQAHELLQAIGFFCLGASWAIYPGKFLPAWLNTATVIGSYALGSIALLVFLIKLGIKR